MGSPSGPPRPDAAEPKCGAEAETIDASLAWHIVRMSPGKGTKALDGLKKAKVAVFRPQTSEVVVRRGRRVIRRAPLLLRTAFIGVNDAEHLAVARGLPGVAEVVSHLEEDKTPTGNISGLVMRPARLDPEALQGFADRLAKGEIVQPVGIKAGDKVIIREGSFASFPATVDGLVPCDDPHEPPQVKLSVAIFGRSTPIVLGIAEIQVVT